MNADLHAHSCVSDGALAPAEVVRRAVAHGVQLFALTDHDEVGGLDEARDAATALGLVFVAGVEISVTWGGETIHVVGLRIDPACRALREGLARTRSGRDARAREMGDDLARVGIAHAYAGALKYVGNPAMVGRMHFARYIVERGVCRDVQEVFQRYLGEGKPGFVAHRWAKLDDALAWIRAAGGVAVLAHPGRYRLDDTALWALIAAFREAGGEGIEVVSDSTRATSISVSRKSRANSVCWRRAAPISTHRTKAGSISAAWRRCRIRWYRCGATGRRPNSRWRAAATPGASAAAVGGRA